MKTFNELFDGVIKHEGYYANIDGDRGGETYMGVARNLHPDWPGWQFIDAHKKEFGPIKWNTRIDNNKLEEAVEQFYYITFYDNYRIYAIMDGSLQEIIFDWCVNSGRYGSKGVQQVLNNDFNHTLIIDGIIGEKTILAIRKCEPKELFSKIKKARIKYYYAISKKGKNHLFLEGWLKRINSIDYSLS